MSSSQTESERSNFCKSLNYLNDDCLVLIFEFLSVPDRLIAEAVCQRWQNLCSLLWKKTCSFDVTDEQLGFIHNADSHYPLIFRTKNIEEINVQLSRTIFSKCQLHLTKIKLSRATKLESIVFTEAGHDCPVDFLEIPRRDYQNNEKKLEGTLNDLRDSLLECNNIEELSLCQCVINVDDECLSQLFKKNKKLRTIVLSKYQSIGECFTHLSTESLESIILFECETDFKHFNTILPLASKLHTLRLKQTLKPNSRSVFRIAPSNPTNLLHASIEDSIYRFRYVSDFYGLKNLMSLKLKRVNLNDEMLKLIVENCAQLRQLDVTLNEDLTDVSIHYINRLPHLICLGIGYNEDLTNSGLLALEKDLRELHVPASEFTPDALLTTLQKMQSLEQLDVSFDKYLDHNFVKSAMDIVNARPNEIPLVIGVFGVLRYGVGTKIADCIVSEIGYTCPSVFLNDGGRLILKYDRYV